MDQDIFKKHLIDLLMPYDEIDPKICFNAINESFDQAYSQNLKKINKVTLYHQHNPSFLSGLILIIFTLIIKLFV